MNIFQLIGDPSNYSITTHGIVLIITIVIALLLGIIVLVRDQASSTSRLYFLYTLLISVWFFGLCGASWSKNPEIAQIWIKFAHIGIVFIPAVIFHVVIRALDRFKTYKKRVILIWIISSVLLLIPFFMPGYLGEPYLYNWGFYPRYSFKQIFFITYLIYILSSIYSILKSYYKRVQDDIHIKKRFRISMLAILISGFATFDLLPAFGIGIYPLGYLFLLVGIILSAFVAWRYRFINIIPAIVMEGIIESISEAVLIIDNCKAIRYVNRSACQQFGFSEEKLLWKSIKNAFQDTDFVDNLKTCLEKGESSNEELRYTDPKGKKIDLILSFSNIYDQQNNQISTVCLFHDITDYKKIQNQLKQIQKLDSISSLTSNISHNFNNLLTIINGYAEICLLKLGDNHPVSSSINVIHEAGKRAENLVRQLLAFSQNQKIDLKTIDINETIMNSKKLLEQMIGVDIKIDTLLSQEPIIITADPRQFEQILINLTTNAKDAILEKKNSNSDRKIVIKTDRRCADERIKAIQPQKQDKHYGVISFIDNGIGFEEKDIEKIFEPFYTTKEDETGSDLRLASVYGIVKQNNGFIFVFSQPDQGATFEIFWPITKENTSSQISDQEKQ